MRCFFIIVFCFPIFASAQLQLAKIFSDNMVLQRNQAIKIWGKASPGKIVTVSFAKEKQNVIVQNDSGWSVIFKKQKANAQPQSILITSSVKKIEIKNILIGDVWLCIGQSNMEWPMVKELHYKEEIANSKQPFIRLYNPAYAGKNTFNVLFTDSIIQNLTVEKFYKRQWQTCDSNSFKTMSAVAYYFGKGIVKSTNVPLGLINLSIGGAPLETFISSAALKKSKHFYDKLNGDWLTNNVLPVWIRERGKQNAEGLINVPKDEYGNNHPFKPGFAYQSGIAQLLNLRIKGILCYQGESNAQEKERVNEYAALSKLMVDDFRTKWNQPKLPFYFVQLSSIDTFKYKGQLWPQFRNEQRKMLQLISNSGMVVCSDIGSKDDVHPKNKKYVGERLARLVLNKTYGQQIIPSGPLPVYAKYKNGKVLIRFQYLAQGLKISDSDTLHGFSIDGKNEIEAKFGHSGVLIFTNVKPEYIYYGWKSFSDGNLVNSANLPASTFKIKVQ